jgi:hypothetical protein
VRLIGILEGITVTVSSCARGVAPLAIMLCVACFSAWAGDPNGGSQPPAQLIRHVVDKEVQAIDADHSHWMYRQHHVDPTKNIVEECVQTKDGDLCRHLAEDGHPLTEQQERKRINNLLNNPEQERKAQKAKNHDGDEALRLLKMLPDAFSYQYDGQEGQYVRLKFQPNPDFTPPTREARVFHAMAGVVLVDAKAQRLAELKGKLVKDVDFGWGVLGHLYQGGTFAVKRQDVGDGHWDITLLDVDIHGKALFFHTINAQQREVTTDYKKVSDNLNFAQGASMLFSPNLQAKATAGGN